MRKKIIMFLVAILLVNCSSSVNEVAKVDIPNTSTDTKINLPDWLNGTYKSDNFGAFYGGGTLYYPKANPYSIQFVSQTDIMTKSIANSPIESVQQKINDFSSLGKLISV